MIPHRDTCILVDLVQKLSTVILNLFLALLSCFSSTMKKEIITREKKNMATIFYTSI